MIVKIKKIRKRMAKVQKRSYNVRFRNSRSMLFKHLCDHDYSQKILTHLAGGIEKELFIASLKNLSDKGNPLRFNNFAYCMREIIGIILDKYSDDVDIKRCQWFIQADDTDVTRVQRVTYAICGGMSRDYVKENILENEDDEENLLDKTLKSFNKKFRILSVYTHVRAEKNFNISNVLCEKLTLDVLKITNDIVSLIEDCRKEIQSKVYEKISNAVIDESLQSTLDGLDILSTHGYVEYVNISEYEVSTITSQHIIIDGSGNASCTLEWGSGSDFRNDNGATMNEEFPLKFRAHISVNNLDDVSIFEGDIDINNESWFQ
ncbi:hypothetical protein AB6896_04425 [Rahnella inusitata]|uniref:pPIWI-associating nuclease domain-containing protein n=1 Tax=Rahnella inusitata TaxID=58169 RepID=UPI0039BEA844